MIEFWEFVPMILNEQVIALLAAIAAIETLALALYLIRKQDHLILHHADQGMLGMALIGVMVHYLLNWLAPDHTRNVATLRIAWGLFLLVIIVIMTRYIIEIRGSKGSKNEKGTCTRSA